MRRLLFFSLLFSSLLSLLHLTSLFPFFFSLVSFLKTAESRALTYGWEGSRTEKRWKKQEDNSYKQLPRRWEARKAESICEES